jgi:hypothetical protein
LNKCFREAGRGRLRGGEKKSDDSAAAVLELVLVSEECSRGREEVASTASSSEACST